jgi:hypothetical protein
VRTGVDIEGNPFPDKPGSTLQEEFYLRSWTHETYLWNTEVVDQDPHGFTTDLNYFNVLKTTATTPSGKPKDRFHFADNTADFLASVDSEPQPSYGAEYIAFATTPPRDFRILYTEPSSPASALVNGHAALIRGDKVLTIDGVDMVSGSNVTTLNNGLFPTNVGESHTFVVQDPDGSAPRTVTLTAANVAPKAVNRSLVISTPTGGVGYVLLNTFNTNASELEIANAITAMKAAGISDLILDLRYNGGGLLAVASELGFAIAGPAQTTGKVFERLEFNASAGNLDPVTGQINQPLAFLSTGQGFSLPNNTPLAHLDLVRVFVLTGQTNLVTGTCSASEAVINGLRGVNVNVVLIGDTTCGKPYGFYPQDNCGETYFSIQFQGVNDMSFGDYADGFIAQNSPAAFGVRAPGCYVPDDFNHELGSQSEALLAAALQYRANGSCPAVSPAAVAASNILKPAGVSALDVKATNLTPLQQFLRQSRDMRKPY